jgi:uncharacterized protein YkwD
MLQSKYRMLSLLALAVAAPGVAYSEAASPALLSPGESATPAQTIEVDQFDQQLLQLVQAARYDSGVAGLAQHPSLTAVAQAHAKDMAKRRYAADVTPEGLSLIDTVRQQDRQTLYSAFGTTVAIAEAGANPSAVLAALLSDPANSENLLRNSFDHVGIGSFEQDGRLYVVQLLARVEGQLKEPLPMDAVYADSLRAEFSARGMTPVSWSVSDGAGQTLLRGSGERIRDSQGAQIEGYLNLDVAMGPDVYTFRGPYVRVK